MPVSPNYNGISIRYVFEVLFGVARHSEPWPQTLRFSTSWKFARIGAILCREQDLSHLLITGGSRASIFAAICG